MKKTIVLILAVLLLALCAVSLFAVLDRSKTVYFPPEENSAEISFTNDKTALPPFVYNTSTISSSELYTVYRVEDDYAKREDADTVVLATVVDVFYTFIDGEAWTQSNVRVDEVMRGKLREGDIVSVYSRGGYASAEDYEREHGKGKYSETDAGFLEFIINDVPHPACGDNRVFYLERPPVSGLPSGAYLRLNIQKE